MCVGAWLFCALAALAWQDASLLQSAKGDGIHAFYYHVNLVLIFYLLHTKREHKTEHIHN